MAALVIVEAIQLFLVAPLSAEIKVPGWSFLLILTANVTIVLAVVWRRPIAVVAVLLATLMEVAAVASRMFKPSGQTEALDFAAALTLLVALTVVLAMTVFGPGRVTVYRIVGAIAIYLNIASAFALAYRTIDSLKPDAFASSAGALASNHLLPTLIYYSFTTLTTTGYGDIVPLDPFVRSLSNVESVIGQLFPATLLARLITLEIEHRRGERP